MLKFFLIAFLVSLVVGFLTVRSHDLHARFTSDVAVRGSHKVHRTAVSRIGGVSIFIGWAVALLIANQFGRVSGNEALIWLVCLLPVFVGGLAEDFTKQIRPALRLLAAILSGALAYTLLGAAVTRVDVPLLDLFLKYPAIAFAFTCIGVAGVAHAINIIDGLNGLASGVCLIALLALGYVAFQVSDLQIVWMAGLCAGALLGFRVWNYPSGRIFCGDGGAYFLGAYIAILSALLVYRHPQVSAWFPLLLVLYPVWETLFSAYRRRVLRGLPMSKADKLHMHTLVYKRVKNLGGGGRARSQRNSDASVWMMIFASGPAVPAVVFWADAPYLMIAAIAYIVAYLAVYRRLVRFGVQPQAGAYKRGVAYVAQRVAGLHRATMSRRSIREPKKLR